MLKQAGTVLAEVIVGAMIGFVLFVVVLLWVLTETYQSVNLPSTPLPVRIATTATAWLAIAAGLGWKFPATAWKWGVYLAIPVGVFMIQGAFLKGHGDDQVLAIGLVAASLLVGCLGGHAGADARRRRTVQSREGAIH